MTLNTHTVTLNYTHSGTQIINSDTQLHTQWHSATHTVTLNNTHSNTQLHTQWHSTTHMVTLNYKQWHSTLHTVALNTSYTATLSSTHSDAMTQTLLSYVPLGPVIHTLPLQLPWWIFCIFFSFFWLEALKGGMSVQWLGWKCLGIWCADTMIC